MAARQLAQAETFDAFRPEAGLLCSLSFVEFDPFETPSQVAFLRSFVDNGGMTAVVNMLANLWWRSI